MKVKTSLLLVGVLSLCLICSIGVIIGMMSKQTQPMHPFSATASHGNDSFAIATGFIDTSLEGVFFLDFLTGDIQVWVMNPRTGKFFAKFTGNVIADLGVKKNKKPAYVMTTGSIEFPRGAGPNLAKNGSLCL